MTPLHGSTVKKAEPLPPEMAKYSRWPSSASYTPSAAPTLCGPTRFSVMLREKGASSTGGSFTSTSEMVTTASAVSAGLPPSDTRTVSE